MPTNPLTGLFYLRQRPFWGSSVKMRPLLHWRQSATCITYILNEEKLGWVRSCVKNLPVKSCICYTVSQKIMPRVVSICGDAAYNANQLYFLVTRAHDKIIPISWYKSWVIRDVLAPSLYLMHHPHNCLHMTPQQPPSIGHPFYYCQPDAAPTIHYTCWLIII